MEEATFPTSSTSPLQGASRPKPEDLFKALAVQVSEEPLVERKLMLQLQLVAALGAAHSFKCTESLEAEMSGDKTLPVEDADKKLAQQLVGNLSGGNVELFDATPSPELLLLRKAEAKLLRLVQQWRQKVVASIPLGWDTASLDRSVQTSISDIASIARLREKFPGLSGDQPLNSILGSADELAARPTQDIPGKSSASASFVEVTNQAAAGFQSAKKVLSEDGHARVGKSTDRSSSNAPPRNANVSASSEGVARFSGSHRSQQSTTSCDQRPPNFRPQWPSRRTDHRPPGAPPPQHHKNKNRPLHVPSGGRNGGFTRVTDSIEDDFDPDFDFPNETEVEPNDDPLAGSSFMSATEKWSQDKRKKHGGQSRSQGNSHGGRRGAGGGGGQGDYHPYTSVFNNSGSMRRGKGNSNNNNNNNNNSNGYGSSSSSGGPSANGRRGFRSKRKFEPPGQLNNDNQQDNYNSRDAKRGSGGRDGGKKKAGNGGSGDDQYHSELCEHEKLRGFDAQLIENIEKEILDQGQKIGWDDIAGLQDAKRIITEVVVWPMLRPDIFHGLLACPKGLLLFGPPGTGKTMIGKAIASECNATFFSISASSLTSKWVGQGEKLVRVLFTVASIKAPSVIFIDEIDSLLTQRSEGEIESTRRIKTEFLVQLDGVGSETDSGRVLVVGATNRPQELDEAARRRFVKRCYIPLPESSARASLVSGLLAKNGTVLPDGDLAQIVSRTEGFSGADMHNLCTAAAMGPIREFVMNAGASKLGIESLDKDNMRGIGLPDFDAALSEVRASVAPKEVDAYIDWNKQFGTALKGS